MGSKKCEIKKNEVIEIDFKKLFFLLLDKLWIILIVGLLMSVGAGLYSKIYIKPVYTSTTKIYVINRQSSETTTLSDLQTGTQLTKDYMILVKSRPVLEQVISNLNLDISQQQLADMISVNTPNDTRILEIAIEQQDAYMAKILADEIAKVSAERMVSVMEMEKVNVVEQGNLPTAPSGPNIKINIIIGAIAGIFLTTCCFAIIDIFNDSIRTSEDIEKYLGVTTLGMIPLEEGVANKNKEKKLRNKKVVEQIN